MMAVREHAEVPVSVFMMMGFARMLQLAMKRPVRVLVVMNEMSGRMVKDHGRRRVDQDRPGRVIHERPRRVVEHGRRRGVHDDGRRAAAEGDAEGKAAGLGGAGGGGQEAQTRHPGEYAGSVFHTYTYRRDQGNRVQVFANSRKLFAG